MKCIKRHMELFRPKPFSSWSTQSTFPPLTEKQLAQTNYLIPKLCLAGDIGAATRLAMSAILANPPPRSLCLTALLDSLASKPGSKIPISFLKRLTHVPPCSRHIPPAAAHFVVAYFRKSRPDDAFALFQWLINLDEPFYINSYLAKVFISGFSRYDMEYDCLRVLRVMVTNYSREFKINEHGELAYRALLRVARIREATELREALESRDVNTLLSTLDRIMKHWT